MSPAFNLLVDPDARYAFLCSLRYWETTSAGVRGELGAVSNDNPAVIEISWDDLSALHPQLPDAVKVTVMYSARLRQQDALRTGSVLAALLCHYTSPLAIHHKYSEQPMHVSRINGLRWDKEEQHAVLYCEAYSVRHTLSLEQPPERRKTVPAFISNYSTVPLFVEQHHLEQLFPGWRDRLFIVLGLTNDSDNSVYDQAHLRFILQKQEASTPSLPLPDTLDGSVVP